MANHNCAICGASVNLFKQQKLADGNYICRKTCRAKGFKQMDYVNATLDQVKAHLKQVEYGTKLWKHYFTPRQKTNDKSQKLIRISSSLYIARDIGLMALVDRRYKVFVFGKTEHACVYRIADLHEYSYEVEEKRSSDGKAETLHYVHLFFGNVEGLSDFKVKLSSKVFCEAAIKTFDELFGIQKTVGNIKNTWKRQVNAIKDVAAGVEAVASKSDGAAEKAAEAVDSLNTMVYGDRSEWIAKADAALNAFRG
jgi:hypothetical protein